MTREAIHGNASTRSRQTFGAAAWVVLCLCLLIPTSATAQGNLVDNGDFESGNTGFTSSYTFTTGAILGANTYGIDDNPRDRHSSWVTMGDHTSGTGDMMLVNGSPITGPAGFVWQSPAAGSIAIAPNTDYFFEAFVANVYPVNGAILTFEAFNSATSSWDTLGTADLRSVPVANWQASSFIWNSGTNTSTQLRLLNAQPAGGGNDFAIDDIFFGAESSIVGIALEKTADGPDPLVAGAIVSYTFVVTNTGTVTLSNVGVTDPLPDLSAISCPDDALAPTAEMTCTASYTVTQDDVDAGIIENTATVTGTPPGDLPEVSDQSSATVFPTQLPDISIDKTGGGPVPLLLGDTVDYAFLVTNTGNVTLTAVTVTDPLPGLSAISCPGASLAANASMICTAGYIVTQDDVDAGVIQNTATATGTPPPDLPDVSDQDSAMVSPTQLPGIDLDKSGSGPDPLTLGGTVDYTFLVTNTGNVTLTGVTVTDPLPGLSPIDCSGVTTLAPGADVTCTASYTVTSNDVDEGFIQNTATVTGQPPGGLPEVTDQDSTAVPPNQQVGINLDKTASTPEPLLLGDTVEYTFVVTNTGNVSLTDVVVTDPLPGLSAIICPADSLLAGDDMSCAASYTVTQADVDAGLIQNTAQVTAQPPGDRPEVIDQDAATVSPSRQPGITLDKGAMAPDPLSFGDTVDYTLVVTNTGNVTLTEVTVTDPLPGLSAISCPGAMLAPDDNMTCTASYTISQGDVNAGVIENTATALGTPPSGLGVSDEDSAEVSPGQLPAIAIDKTGDGSDPLVAGETVSYEFLVTNTGNVTLTGVTVTDPMPGLSPIDCSGITTLAPGANMTCTASYTVTQDDVDAGTIQNTATVQGSPPGGPEVTGVDSALVPPQPPSLPPGEPRRVPTLPVPGLALLALLLSAGAVWNLRLRTRLARAGGSARR